MAGLFKLYRCKTFNFVHIVMNFLLFMIYISFMQIPVIEVQNFVTGIVLFLLEIQLLDLLSDQKWNDMQNLLPIRSMDFFVSYLKMIMIFSVEYVLFTVWYDNTVTQIYFLFPTFPALYLYIYLMKMRMSSSKNEKIRFLYIVITGMTLLFTLKMLVKSEAVYILVGNSICIGIIALALFASIYRIKHPAKDQESRQQDI